jgi:hypothetical protein
VKRAREAAAVTVQLFPWMPPMENPFKPIFEFIAHTYYLVLPPGGLDEEAMRPLG